MGRKAISCVSGFFSGCDICDINRQSAFKIDYERSFSGLEPGLSVWVMTSYGELNVGKSVNSKRFLKMQQ